MEGSEGISGPSGDQSGGCLGGRSEGQSEGIWEVNLRVNLRNLMEYLRLAFIWPWVGPKAWNMVKYGSWRVLGVVPGIALPGTHQPYPTPGTPLPSPPVLHQHVYPQPAVPAD